jgi:hypothetical protein
MEELAPFTVILVLGNSPVSNLKRGSESFGFTLQRKFTSYQQQEFRKNIHIKLTCELILKQYNISLIQ